MNSLKLAFAHLWAFLTGLGQAELDYIETNTIPQLKTAIGKIIMQLAPLALEAVLAAEVPGVAGTEKFNNAFNQLKDSAQSAGIAATTQLLNQAIEDQVGLLTAKLAANTVNSAK